MTLGPIQNTSFQATASLSAFANQAPAALGFPTSFSSGFAAFESSGLDLMMMMSMMQTMTMLGGGFGAFLGGGVPQAQPPGSGYAPSQAPVQAQGYGTSAPAQGYGGGYQQPAYQAPVPEYKPAPAPAYEAPKPPEPPKQKGGYA